MTPSNSASTSTSASASNPYPPPSGCLSSLEGGTAQLVMEALTYPETATVELKQWNGSSGDLLMNLAAPDLDYLASTINLDYLKFQYVITDGANVYTTDWANITLNCCGDELESLIPPRPDKPTAVIDWPNEKITVTAPAWPTGVYLDELRQELQRSLDNTIWSDVTTWSAAAGTFIESPAAAFQTYYYRMRNCNAAGCSEWSDVLLVQIISATATVTWTTPAAGEVRRAVDLVFHVSDTIGDTTDQEIQARPGGTIGPLGMIAGTAQNGDFHALWDTQNYYEGGVILRAQVLGSDGLPAFADQNVTVNNGASTWPQYRDFQVDSGFPGTEIFALRTSVETGKISSKDLHRYWVQVGVRGVAMPIVTAATDPDDAEAAWQKHQMFPMAQEISWPARGLTPAGAVTACRRGLDVPAATAYARLRAEPSVAQRLWQTGREEITQITQISEKVFWVLAKDLDDSAAEIWKYDGESFTLLYDLATWSAESTFCFAPVMVSGGASTTPDGLLVALTDGLLLIDLNPATAPLDAAQEIIPRRGSTRETKTLKTVVPLDAGTLILYTGGGDTQAYLRGSFGLRPIWSLMVEIDLARWRDGKVLLASGQYLLSGSSETAAPTNVKMFSSAIVAMDTGRVVLANGELWEENAGVWSLITTFANSGNALEMWQANRLDEFAVQAGDDLWLRWPDRVGQWGDGFLIQPPSGSTDTGGSPSGSSSETISKVLSLAHWKSEIPNTVSPPGGGTTPPKQYDDRLLFGGDAGTFGEVRISRLNETDGAFLATGEEAVTLIPTWRAG